MKARLEKLVGSKQVQTRGFNMARFRVLRVVLAFVVALGAVTVAVTGATPEQAKADPANLRLEWRWGDDPQGARCTITATVGSQVSEGKVRVTGTFQGCDDTWDVGAGDGALTVHGYGKDGAEDGYSHFCNDVCRITAEVPFTGPGTYCGLVFYYDTLYLIKHGHDPRLRPCRYVSGEPPVFPSDEIPPEPPEPSQPPPVNPPPETPCPQVSSLSVVPDGAVLETCDTGRVYKMVGGAPLWMTTCAGSMCPGTKIKVTQSMIDAGRPYPRDAATARDEAGNVFKFVGGAPVHLSSCTVGCGSPISVPAGTLQLVHSANHLRQRPVDGATARDEAGHVFKFVGGAPIHLSSCSVGCGRPVPINGWSVANLDHMNPVPTDGATARDEAGNVFKFVGGAPIHLSSCSVGCGSPVPITAWSIVHYEHMNPRPADGATARDEAGNVFKFVGGAPIHLSSCTVGCGSPVPINGWSVATLEHMNPVPVDGATARDEAGNVFKFVGGAPVHVSSCSVGCGSPVPITAWSVANLDHMRAVPTDNATVETETGAVYKFAGGAPLRLANCDPGCGNRVRITQWSIDTREHMRQVPVGGTNLRAVDTGTLFRIHAGEADLAGQCPAGSGCGSVVTVNQSSIDPIAHGVANRGPAYGELARYSDGTDHHTTTGSVPAGYRLEGVFGLLSLTAAPGTLPLFACRVGTDHFSSSSESCEGKTVVGRLGWIYTSPPEGQPSAAVFRCRTSGGEHFDSFDSACGGHTVEGRLGYVLAYAGVTRYHNGGDHRTATTGVPAGYQPEGALGMLPLVSQPGTVSLYACEVGGEGFSSTSSTCEGKTVVGRLGWIYTSPPEGQPSAAVFRCRTSGGEHFDSFDSACGGHTVEGRLGYLLAERILTRAVRGTDHRTGSGVLPPGYRHEGTFGYLAGTNEPGTRALYSCRSGGDAFTSLDENCEGREKLERLGWIWRQPPPDVPSIPLYRCKVDGTGEHFDATSADCEGHNEEGFLGYVRVQP